MGVRHGPAAKREQVQAPDQRQGIDLEPGTYVLAHTMICWGWDGCLIGNTGGHHGADLAAEGTNLDRCQPTLLCKLGDALCLP